MLAAFFPPSSGFPSLNWSRRSGLAVWRRSVRTSARSGGGEVVGEEEEDEDEGSERSHAFGPVDHRRRVLSER
jgi:hypothetical protein